MCPLLRSILIPSLNNNKKKIFFNKKFSLKKKILKFSTILEFLELMI